MCIYCTDCHICIDHKQYLKPKENSMEDNVIFQLKHNGKYYEVLCLCCENYLCEYHFSLTKEEFPISGYNDSEEAYVKHCLVCKT